jgi:hypothetical protein
MTTAPGSTMRIGGQGSGAIIGAGLTLGLTLTSKLFCLVLGRKKRVVKAKAAKGSAGSSLASKDSTQSGSCTW